MAAIKVVTMGGKGGGRLQITFSKLFYFTSDLIKFLHLISLFEKPFVCGVK